MRGIIDRVGLRPLLAARSGCHSDVPRRSWQGHPLTVASYDEDTTTLAVEAGRLALRGAPSAEPTALWFATASPTYLEKTNTGPRCTRRSVLMEPRLPTTPAAQCRSGVGALRTALASTDAVSLVASADMRTGMANSPDESAGGDAGAAVLHAGDSAAAPLIAEFLGAGFATASSSTGGAPPGTSAPSSGRSDSARTSRRVRASRHTDGHSTRAVWPPTTSTRRWWRVPAVGPTTAWPRSWASLRRARISRMPSATAGPLRSVSNSPPCSSRRPQVENDCGGEPLRRARTSWCSGPRTRSPSTARSARSPIRSRRGTRRCPTPSTWRGGASYRRTRPTVPNRPGPPAARGGAFGGLEVRVRGLEGQRVGGGAHAAGAGELRRGQRRRHVPAAHGRCRGHGGDVHRRPPGLLTQPPGHLRRGRLRRRRADAGRGVRRHRRRHRGGRSSRDDVPPHRCHEDGIANYFWKARPLR